MTNQESGNLFEKASFAILTEFSQNPVFFKIPAQKSKRKLFEH